MGTDPDEEPVVGVGPPSPRHMIDFGLKQAAGSISSPIKPPHHGGGGEIDLEAWRGDLRRLHLTIDQAVQSFIANQTQQLDSVVTELAAQKERILVRERYFEELGDSIAGFVETEAQRTELWGLPLVDAEADARHEEYDAELPGPPVLHRINRLWRKMTRAFEVTKEANAREASKAVSDERARLEALVAAADERCEKLRCEHAAEVEALRLSMEKADSTGREKEDALEDLSAALGTAIEKQRAADAQLKEMEDRLEDSNTARSRAEYEWDAEREELTRERAAAITDVEELQKSLESSKERETELFHLCAERAEKLEQMKKIMDDQEREMTMKIDRVQQYVKERQAGAMSAEKKQQDAERLADRWQREVQRLQAEKDRLAAVVLDLETHKTGQAQHMQGTNEQHQHEINRLQEALRQKEEAMVASSKEALQKCEADYQNKLTAEREREKNRSIGLMNKKQQELLLKEQQLKAARQRIQELEGQRPGTPGSSGGSRRASCEKGDAALPPLPMSAR